MVLFRTFVLLCFGLFVIAGPAIANQDPNSADTAILVARTKPQRPANAPAGGRPSWAGKFSGKVGGGQAKAQAQPHTDSTQSSPEESGQAQPQSNKDGSSGGSGSGGAVGGKGGSASEQSQSKSLSSGDSPQQKEKQQPQTAAASGGSGYMAVVSKWRSAMGLPAFAQDSKLEANAMDTSKSSGGQLKHKLNSGSMGQVMAPGSSGNFESVFVGGWLCEMPSLPGLGSSTCGSMSKGWNHAGQTGHAKILSDGKYKKIGCALASGIWTCDVA